jgi:hypothetical protein
LIGKGKEKTPAKCRRLLFVPEENKEGVFRSEGVSGDANCCQAALTAFEDRKEGVPYLGTMGILYTKAYRL